MSGYTPLPQQGGAPYPNQAGYPPQGQPYPPQGQPYPPQGQGYASQGQGYGYQQAQGYPPQGQGYPPQGQGYPPQGQGAPGGQQVPSYKGDMPAEDVNDNPNMQPPTSASAPPPDLPQSMPGYSNIGFEEAFVPPPPYEEAVREPPNREAIAGSIALSENDVREALMDYVSQHCCYGKGPVKDMKINDLGSTSGFHYILESFCEARTSKWISVPYRGEPIQHNGAPPNAWEISMAAPEMFKDTTVNVEVPNTAFVKPCHQCFAMGYQRCYRCFGRGMLRCNMCHGTGTRQHGADGPSRCISCHGHGRKSCYTCHGYGQTACTLCQAASNLKWYIQLTIKWATHKEDYVVERTDLPPHLIKGVQGKTALSEVATRVYPINHFPDNEINKASSDLVTKHSTQFPTERMLQQRQTLRIVPVTGISYKYSDKHGQYFVYGLENKVFFPDYPASCCWGCNVL